MKIKLLIFLLLLTLISVISLVNAQQISVVREAKNSVQLNEILDVKININNPSKEDVRIEVLERILNSVTLVQPSSPDKTEFHDAIEVSFFRWETSVPANKIITLSYKIKPDKLGEYTLPPTKVINLNNNEVYTSQALNLNVLCSPNNLCEENENSLNCPEDCGSGILDGICDYRLDGKCDPDCEYDPDCGKVAPSKFDKNILFYILTFVIIIIILIILFRIRSKK